MARRRRLNPTSAPRYTLKAYRVHYMPGLPESLVMNVAMSQSTAWMGRFGQFNTVWEEKVKPLLVQENVPQALHGLYRGFTNEFLSKVVIKGSARREEIVDKWTGLGLRRDILDRIADVLLELKPHTEAGGGG